MLGWLEGSVFDEEEKGQPWVSLRALLGFVDTVGCVLVSFSSSSCLASLSGGGTHRLSVEYLVGSCVLGILRWLRVFHACTPRAIALADA